MSKPELDNLVRINNACSYQSLKSILKRSLDQQTVLELDSEQSGPHHGNIRGAQYYEAPPNARLQ